MSTPNERGNLRDFIGFGSLRVAYGRYFWRDNRKHRPYNSG